jgi:hypothetical protein
MFSVAAATIDLIFSAIADAMKFAFSPQRALKDTPQFNLSLPRPKRNRFS